MIVPQIVPISIPSDLKDFHQTHPHTTVLDHYQSLLKELYFNTNPKIFFSSPESKQTSFDKYFQQQIKSTPEALGQWVYFPWNHHLYHLLDATQYYQLRTIRNKNLITDKQQHQLHQTSISLAGLSVGKSILLSLVRLGIGNSFNIADNDIFELSNSNRASYDLTHYQQPKIRTTTQELFQIDPYLKINQFEDGLSQTNLPKFVSSANLIIDSFPSNLPSVNSPNNTKFPSFLAWI